MGDDIVDNINLFFLFTKRETRHRLIPLSSPFIPRYHHSHLDVVIFGEEVDIGVLRGMLGKHWGTGKERYNNGDVVCTAYHLII